MLSSLWQADQHHRQSEHGSTLFNNTRSL